jgi:hypothetical protein
MSVKAMVAASRQRRRGYIGTVGHALIRASAQR